MTQITANLMEKTNCNELFQGNSPCFRWFNKEALWPLRSLENFFPQITKLTFKSVVCTIYGLFESLDTVGLLSFIFDWLRILLISSSRYNDVTGDVTSVFIMQVFSVNIKNALTVTFFVRKANLVSNQPLKWSFCKKFGYILYSVNWWHCGLVSGADNTTYIPCIFRSTCSLYL